ncbi:hypothetical protein [Streptomyces radicis]|uniref:Uncharacterized protein n=1 Tax=Streptomyces radicis TaxID=1750517 RepID=A0A3A9WBK5_9ACTN|nr:hypothetical protein [Streptomyces radicis]RKN09713.1 hypothetical protein D7319_11720 [Streptomyces radicis]RKN23351.1 hypothetical protein D7318_12675 [Streptomyces radicis]
MNQALRHIGRSLAIALPAVLVLSGTLAVTHVPWAGTPSGTQMLTASAEQQRQAPEDVLRDQLVTTLRAQDPGVALTELQRAVDRDPALAPHCQDIARALGEAAVEKYGSPQRAQQHARPVCDTAYASGVAAAN